jgi:hypothetical protein
VIARPVHKLAALAVLFFLSGVITMAWSYFSLQKWEQVPARVSGNAIVQFQTPRGPRYRGELELRYSVRDIIYRVPYSMAASYRTDEAARDDIVRYRLGTVQPVFVNPSDPNDLLLERRSSLRFFLIPLALTVLGMAFGFICMLLFWSMGHCMCPGCATSVGLHHKFCSACARPLPRQSKLIRAYRQYE